MSKMLEDIERANEINRLYVARKFRAAQKKKDYALENEHTVSTVEKLQTSGFVITKLYNFADKEITTMLGERNMHIQQFSEISDQTRLEKAADALKAYGGDPGNWQSPKPGTQVAKSRLRQKRK